jgi:tetratricopeptide (TPR) repeat protein
MGDRSNCGWVLLQLGEVADALSDYEMAMAYLEESLALWDALGNRIASAQVLYQLGRVAQHQGDWPTARSRYAASVRTRPMHDVIPELLWGLAGLAVVAGAQGEPERAARLFGAIEALTEVERCSFAANERVDHERSVAAAAARAVLGEEAFAAAWAEGRAMPLDEALRLALEEGETPTSPC